MTLWYTILCTGVCRQNPAGSFVLRSFISVDGNRDYGKEHSGKVRSDFLLFHHRQLRQCLIWTKRIMLLIVKACSIPFCSTHFICTCPKGVTTTVCKQDAVTEYTSQAVPVSYLFHLRGYLGDSDRVWYIKLYHSLHRQSEPGSFLFQPFHLRTRACRWRHVNVWCTILGFLCLSSRLFISRCGMSVVYLSTRMCRTKSCSSSPLCACPDVQILAERRVIWQHGLNNRAAIKYCRIKHV